MFYSGTDSFIQFIMGREAMRKLISLKKNKKHSEIGTLFRGRGSL
jgi:hypothetical protein